MGVLPVPNFTFIGTVSPLLGEEPILDHCVNTGMLPCRRSCEQESIIIIIIIIIFVLKNINEAKQRANDKT